MIISALEELIGPLSTFEAQRAARRPSLIWWRLATASLLGLCVLSAFWNVWFAARIQSQVDTTWAIRAGLYISQCLLLTLSGLIPAAYIAGALAGELSKGTLGLLLTTHTRPCEIVLARAIGASVPWLMIITAAWPPMILLGRFHGMGFGSVATFLLLPLLIAAGAMGIAMACSVMTRDGRTAMLITLVLEVALITIARSSPSLGSANFSWIDPFVASREMIETGAALPGLLCGVGWTMIAFLGAGIAVAQLGPAWARTWHSGRATDRKPRFKAARDDLNRDLTDPIAWKERRARRSGFLGRWGELLAAVGTALMTVAAVAIVVALLAESFQRPFAASSWIKQTLTELVLDTRWLLALFLQAWIGLAAAISVSAERERATWDSLLLTPLTSREIILGKFRGILGRMARLILATSLAWFVAGLLGREPMNETLSPVISLILGGVCVAALGISCSIEAENSARAIGATCVAWGVAVMAWTLLTIAVLTVFFFIALIVWGFGIVLGLAATRPAPTLPFSLSVAYSVIYKAIQAISVVLLVRDAALRFEKSSGRMSGGSFPNALPANTNELALGIRLGAFHPDETALDQAGDPLVKVVS